MNEDDAINDPIFIASCDADAINIGLNSQYCLGFLYCHNVLKYILYLNRTILFTCADGIACA